MVCDRVSSFRYVPLHRLPVNSAIRMTKHVERSVVALDDSTRPIADPVNPRIGKALNESSPSSRAKHGHRFARLREQATLVQSAARPQIFGRAVS